MDYITIIQGDDTNFLDDQFVVVSFNTEFSLSGFTATFTLGDVTLTYSDLSSKRFVIVLSNQITSSLPIGRLYGELKLIDTQNRIRTVTSIIPFLVKSGVNESITFINNAISVSMHINDTSINVQVETAGISKAQADSYIAQMQTFKNNCENYANSAANSERTAIQNANIAIENAGISTQNTAEIASYRNEIVNNTAITTVYNDLSGENTIGTVAANIGSLNNVSNSMSLINNISGSLDDIEVCSDNIELIQNAPANANSAQTCANNAAISAENALTSERNSFLSENSASESARNALSSSTNASRHSNLAELWATGSDIELQTATGDNSAHSAKHYADTMSAGQVQANWLESDTASKAHILNKPDLSNVVHYEEVDNIISLKNESGQTLELKQTLENLDDVNVSSVSNDEFLVWNSQNQKWENGNLSTLGITSSLDELNGIGGINTSISNLQSNIQTQLGTKSDIAPAVNTLNTSGTVALNDNSINKVTLSGDIIFSLPTISDNTKFHQILVQLDMSTVFAVDLGTTYYFNKTAPDLSEAGSYNLIYEYDLINGHWVCGAMSKGVSE